MNFEWMKEGIGYAASLIILVSLLMTNVFRLRLINGIGSVLFAAYGCTRVDSSPATRTLATVKPYAKAIGTKVKELPPLTEEAHASNPLGTATIMTSLLGKHVNRVVCVHRPTLPTVIEMVRKATRHYTEGTLPTKNPYLPAGGVLVAHVIQTERGPRVVSVERHLLKPEA